MFEDFTKKIFESDGVIINYAIAGDGPPLLLLHGYPQTHIIWHKIASELSLRFTVVASDLRGYGDSSKPSSDSDHLSYSKRAMAEDQVNLMNHLGYGKFLVAGHDRGGRVAHRMALDYPNVISKLMLMDIAPTYTMYHTTDKEFASAYYHWFFLIQPNNFPERMIAANPEYFLRTKFGQFGKGGKSISDEAFSEYLRCWTPETIHASCEDYRASASIDLIHDQLDIDLANKIQCPIHVLWGEKAFVGQKYNVVKEWEKWADKVTGRSLNCGHYLPEEAPRETLSEMLKFFSD